VNGFCAGGETFYLTVFPAAANIGSSIKREKMANDKQPFSNLDDVREAVTL
jgi:hypothetical protein